MDGVPVSKMLEGEMQKLVSMEVNLSKRVIGQDEALEAARERAARAGLQDPNRPIGSFIFLGPTGVGKTETAGAGGVPIRRRACDGASRHVRVHGKACGGANDRSAAGICRLRRGRTVDRGRMASAVFRRAVRRDRKSHPDVFNVLLQILDDGRLTDSKGRVVDFKNTVLIMTSNLGSREIQSAEGDEKQAREAVLMILRDHFKPEFLNRIDDIVVFTQLSREHIAQIIDVQLEKLRKTLEERGITIELDDSARDLLVEQGYDPVYGARPLKRAIQTLIQNPLAVSLLKGDIASGQMVRVSAANGEMKFTPVGSEQKAAVAVNCLNYELQ